MYHRSKQLNVQIIDIRKKWTPLLTKNVRFENVPKNWAGPFRPPSFGQNPKESIIFSGEYLFGETKTCKFLTAAFSFVYEREIFPIKAERIQGVTLSPAGASGWTRESVQANYNMYGFYPHFLQP